MGNICVRQGQTSVVPEERRPNTSVNLVASDENHDQHSMIRIENVPTTSAESSVSNLQQHVRPSEPIENSSPAFVGTSVTRTDSNNRDFVYPTPMTDTAIIVCLNEVSDSLLSTHLNTYANQIRYFNDTEECLNYLRSGPSSNVYLYLPNEADAENLLPTVQAYHYIRYIYAGVKKLHTIQWPVLYPKVKIRSNQNGLLKILRHDLDVASGREEVQPTHTEDPTGLSPPPSPSFWSLLSVEFSQSLTSANSTRPNANQKREAPEVLMNVYTEQTGVLNAYDMRQENNTFMWKSLLIDVLLNLPLSREAKREMINNCRIQSKNDNERAAVDSFESSYAPADAIWWYTQESFLYHQMNAALRKTDINLIFPFRYFIQQLHEQIKALRHAQLKMAETQQTQKIVVYRGQGIGINEMKSFLGNVGCLTQFYSFLSTTTRRSTAKRFAQMAKLKGIPGAVVFEIHIDPTISDIPFAFVRTVSAIQEEDEVLFSMGVTCRIDAARIDDSGTLYVKLSHTKAEDENLEKLIAYIKNQHQGKSSLLTLADILAEMKDFTGAESFYKRLLDSTLLRGDGEKCRVLNNFGRVKAEQGKYDEALNFYKEAETFITNDDEGKVNEASIENNRGMIYYSEAERTRNIVVENDIETDTPVALSLNHRTRYLDLAEKAFAKSLRLKKQYFPSDSTSTAVTMNNLGLVYLRRGDFNRALLLHEQALAIYQKNEIPSHDARMSSIYNNLAAANYRLDRLEEALKLSEKAVQIEHAVRNHTGNFEYGLFMAQRDEIAEALSMRTPASSELVG